MADNNNNDRGQSDSGSGRGNFGNPEQHREAGKQSHKND
jgi:hypothetical protein